MSAISQLKSAAHFGIAFPYTRCAVSIVARHHAHVYIHTNGGEVEKLGLALRKVSFTIPAHDTLQPPYRNFYSQDLPRLMARWQSLETGPLVVPSIGTIQAMATEITRTIQQAASGEPVEVSLIEDSRTLETLSAIFTPSVAAFPTALRSVVTLAPAGVPPSLLSRLAAAVNAAIGLAALGDTLARQWTAKIAEVINLCAAIYALPVMALPSSVQAVETLLALHELAIDLQREAQRRGRAVLTWPTRTPSRLTAGQIAAWIYGDTSRVGELLALNDWDPLNVPAGSVVRYYA